MGRPGATIPRPGRSARKTNREVCCAPERLNGTHGIGWPGMARDGVEHQRADRSEPFRFLDGFPHVPPRARGARRRDRQLRLSVAPLGWNHGRSSTPGARRSRKRRPRAIRFGPSCEPAPVNLFGCGERPGARKGNIAESVWTTRAGLLQSRNSPQVSPRPSRRSALRNRTGPPSEEITPSSNSAVLCRQDIGAVG